MVPSTGYIIANKLAASISPFVCAPPHMFMLIALACISIRHALLDPSINRQKEMRSRVPCDQNWILPKYSRAATTAQWVHVLLGRCRDLASFFIVSIFRYTELKIYNERRKKQFMKASRWEKMNVYSLKQGSIYTMDELETAKTERMDANLLEIPHRIYKMQTFLMHSLTRRSQFQQIIDSLSLKIPRDQENGSVNKDLKLASTKNQQRSLENDDEVDFV